MFFRKRREAKEQERAAAKAAREDARRRLVQDFRERFDKTQRTADPGERCLQMMQLSGDIAALLGETSQSIDSHAMKKVKLPLFGLTGAGLVGGILLSGVCPPAGILFIPAGIAGLVVGSKRWDDEMKRLREENKGLFDDLGEVRRAADEAAKAILDGDVRPLAASPAVNDLFKRVPKLKEDMLAAFMKNTPGGTFPPGKPNPPPPAPQPK